MNPTLNPPKPPYEEPIDNTGRYKLLINENKGATLVEANGTETTTHQRRPVGRPLTQTLGTSRTNTIGDES